MSNPDEVMLRKGGEDARSKPLTPEEQAAFGPADGAQVPDPRPFVRLVEMGRKTAVEVGVEGTF